MFSSSEEVCDKTWSCHDYRHTENRQWRGTADKVFPFSHSLESSSVFLQSCKGLSFLFDNELNKVVSVEVSQLKTNSLDVYLVVVQVIVY